MTSRTSRRLTGCTTGHVAPTQYSDAAGPSPNDWPHLASLIARVRPRGGVLPQTVTMPWTVAHPAAPGGKAPGQHGGWLGKAYDPFGINGDPTTRISGSRVSVCPRGSPAIGSMAVGFCALRWVRRRGSPAPARPPGTDIASVRSTVRLGRGDGGVRDRSGGPASAIDTVVISTDNVSYWPGLDRGGRPAGHGELARRPSEFLGYARR